MEYHDSSSDDRDCARGSRKHTHNKPASNIIRIEDSIYFSEKINYDTVFELIRCLRCAEIDHLDDVKALEAEVKKSKVKCADAIIEPRPIKLYLTTHGGLVHAAFSVVDCIRAMKVPVHTYVSGYVASAGTLISLAGAKRYITPNAFMMIHEIRSGFWGRYSEVRVEHENITKLMDHVTKYYLERTKITKEKLAEMLRTDNDLTAAESKELGLVDEICK